MIQIRHRDQVEAPITDWLREAYEFADAQRAKPSPVKRSPVRSRKATRAKRAKRN
jgi:hypothetical protein